MAAVPLNIDPSITLVLIRQVGSAEVETAVTKSSQRQAVTPWAPGHCQKGVNHGGTKLEADPLSRDCPMFQGQVMQSLP